MLITQAQLINVSGLHARPASDFLKLAKSFQSKIIVRSADAPDEDAVNAKSIVMILSQGFCKGTTIVISADGNDEQAAVSALAALVASGFGEA